MPRRNARDVGLDGVEVHLADSYLPAQFLSPLTNRRTDEYGGSLDSRMRFSEEILSVVRSAAGPTFPIVARISGNEYVDGGLGVADAIAVVRRLCDRRLIDVLSLSVGSYARFYKMVAPSFEPPGYQLVDNAVIARGAVVPTIVTGRFSTLADAEEVLRARRRRSRVDGARTYCRSVSDREGACRSFGVAVYRV